MLDTITRTSSKVLRARSTYAPGLAHPSWRKSLEPADGRAAIHSAGDFWSRLGL